MFFSMVRVLSVLASILLLTTSSAAEDWSQFRGPSSGVAADAKLPVEWGADRNIAWKIKIPGVAWSQPIVWGDKVFVTSAITENQPKPRAGFGGSGRRSQPRGERGSDNRPERGGGQSRGSRGDTPPASGNTQQRNADGQSPRESRPRGFGQRGFGRGGNRPAPEPPDAVYQWKVACLDGNTGEVLWEQLAHEGRPNIATQRTNTYASETPVTDGKHVYAYFGMTGLYCYDLSGEFVWSKKLGSYRMMMGWGTGSSPVLHQDRVFVQCDNEEKSFLVALDKTTGDEVWRVDREEQSNWSTPYVWRNKERTELITAGGRKMRSYDPADGSLLWELSIGRNSCNATPVGDDQLLYVGTGGGFSGGGPLLAVRAGAAGDITPEDEATGSDGVAWSVSRGGPPMASPLLYGGYLYVLQQRGGTLTCYDAKTGEQQYRQRLPDARGFTSSPWAADGKLYCLDEDGRTFVLEAGGTYQLIGVNKLDEMFWSSAAVLNNKLLLRGVDHLYCISP